MKNLIVLNPKIRIRKMNGKNASLRFLNSGIKSRRDDILLTVGEAKRNLRLMKCYTF